MISLNTLIQKNNSISPVDIAGEISFLNVETGKYSFLNSTASYIWRAIPDVPIQVSFLIPAIMEEHIVSEEECTQNLIEFLEELLTDKLIKIVV